MIDRHQPSLRPEGANAGTQRWKDLLFCHWQIDASELRRLVPADLQIDTHAGHAFVGLVPFKMRRIRPHWLPQMMAMDFLETNLRTYVLHNGKPGVYFFSLDANSRLAVLAARLGWSLPYMNATMKTESLGPGSFRYQSWRAGSTASVAIDFSVEEQLGKSKLGTLEHFLFERYLLFVMNRGRVYQGQVHHDPYDVWNASCDAFGEQLIQAAGFRTPASPPDLVHYSPGVDVEVFAIRPS